MPLVVFCPSRNGFSLSAVLLGSICSIFIMWLSALQGSLALGKKRTAVQISLPSMWLYQPPLFAVANLWGLKLGGLRFKYFVPIVCGLHKED